MELRGIVPAIVPAPPPEPFAIQVIIVDWLYRELDSLAEIKCQYCSTVTAIVRFTSIWK
jgi:hypothetical protein